MKPAHFKRSGSALRDGDCDPFCHAFQHAFQSMKREVQTGNRLDEENSARCTGTDLSEAV